MLYIIMCVCVYVHACLCVCVEGGFVQVHTCLQYGGHMSILAISLQMQSTLFPKQELREKLRPAGQQAQQFPSPSLA